MLTSGDVVILQFGVPEGREAGFRHPAVLVTSQRILDREPSVVQVVPLTSTIRPFQSEIVIDADDANHLSQRSAAQCQHVRAIAPQRIESVQGNVGAAVLAQLRETIGIILDIP